MTIYIILVALLNLCVGYYAAVHLGFGQTWWSAGQGSMAPSEAAEAETSTPDANAAQAAEPVTDTSRALADPVEQQIEPRGEPPTPEPEPTASAASDLDQQALPAATESSEEAFEMFGAEQEPVTQEESQETLPAADDASSEPSETSELPSGSSDLDEDVLGVVGACVADFKRELGHYRAQLGEIDSQVREGAQSGQAEQLQQCVGSLRNANVDFLDKQRDVSRRLKSLDDCGGIDEFAANLECAMTEQEALVKFSNINIEQIDTENGLETGFQRLIGETSALSDIASRVHQALQVAEEAIAEARPGPDGENQLAEEEELQEKGGSSAGGTATRQTSSR